MAYLLFAMTTAIAAMYELIVPVFSQVLEENPDTPLIEYKTVTLVTFFLLCVLAAPLIFIPCIIPKSGQRFRNSLKTALLSTKI